MASFNTDSLKADAVLLSRPLHPVLDESGNSQRFSLTDLPLWVPAIEDHVEPCTVDLASCESQTLAVRVRWPSNDQGLSVRLIGALEGSDAQINVSEAQDATPVDGLVTLITRLNAFSQVVPWGFEGNVTWTLQIVATGQQVKLCTHRIELYAVSAKLPPYLANVGIPCEILKAFVLPVKTKGILTFDDYVKHVVNTVHSNTGRRYDRVSGGVFYGAEFNEPYTYTLNISKWAASLRLHRLRQDDDEPFLVNCYDQAAFVQVGTTLGLKSVEQQNGLKWHYLYPFGFINPTHLVGWKGDCNSPYRPDGADFDANLVVNDPTPDQLQNLDANTMRSNFKNHIFMTWNGRVLDATCGPALGTDDLEHYLDKAIDRTTILYGASTALKERYTDNGCPHGGTVDHVKTGPGVDRCSGFGQRDGVKLLSKDNPDPMEKGLQDFLTGNDLPTSWQVEDSTRPGKGATGLPIDQLERELKQLHIGGNELKVDDVNHELSADGAAISFLLSAGVKRIDLMVVIAPTPAAANAVWEQTLKSTIATPGAAFVPAQGVQKRGIRHLVSRGELGGGLHIWTEGRVFIKLNGTKANSALYPIVDLIDKLLVTTDPAPLGEVKLLSNNVKYDDETDTSCSLGSTFELQLQAPNAYYCVVECSTGSALLTYTSNETNANTGNVFNFKFLGRRAGRDTITFTFAEPTFTSWQSTFKWKVDVIESKN